MRIGTSLSSDAAAAWARAGVVLDVDGDQLKISGRDHGQAGDILRPHKVELVAHLQRRLEIARELIGIAESEPREFEIESIPGTFRLATSPEQARELCNGGIPAGRILELSELIDLVLSGIPPAHILALIQAKHVVDGVIKGIGPDE